MRKNIRRILYWSLALIWAIIILLTLPYARQWTNWITERFTGYFIPTTVILILSSFLVYTIVRLIKAKSAFFDYLIFALIVAGYVFSLLQLKIVIEQIHFLEYGLLAYLFLKAIRVDRKDSGGYLIALLLVMEVGVIDEYIQGILPDRVGELHDVYLNVLSGVLALCWYRLLIKPRESTGEFKTALIISLPLSGLIILSVAYFNSKISDFGYYIEDNEIGAFYTRLHPERLGSYFPKSDYFTEEIAPMLYQKEYTQLLNGVNDPVHMEVLVHIFRRDRHIRDEDYITSYRENQILEKYFLPFIENTSHKWDSSKVADIYAKSRNKLSEYYVSPVSAHIITEFSEKTQWIAVVLMQMTIAVITMILIRSRK